MWSFLHCGSNMLILITEAEVLGTNGNNDGLRVYEVWSVTAL